MVDRGEGPKPGTRDNGLRAASYVAVGDLDPRIADDLLDTLRAEGIAAYVAPTPGARGGYLEVRLPSPLTDRLYVDETRADRAAGLLAAEREADPAPAATPADDLDVDTAWRQVLASLQSAAPTTRPWPASEDVEPGSLVTEPQEPTYLEDEEHFQPPEPPPLPTFRPITVASVLAIVIGIVIVVTGIDDGQLGWLGILAILTGAVSLVWHVRQGPPTDSGWDDGAVV
jgi:hypothetical protein